jgi:hypothetical protein
MRRLRDFWFGETDLAPVAFLRILFGLQLFNWFWQLYPNLDAFFTDDGILPRRELLVTYADRFSLLNLFGEWWQVAVVWAVSCVVAILLTVGWRTRLMSFLAFILVSSFSWREPLMLDGSDFVFRAIPLWLVFTGAGELWSIDALRRKDPPTGRGWAFPVRILELQIAWIYLATGLEKLGGTAWIGGTAAFYALQLEHTFGRPWARAIATNLQLSNLISWSTIAVELGFLPLVVIPTRFTRLVAAVAAAGMHMGILLLMNVGNFPVLMLSTCVLFLPPEWIRRLMRKAGAMRPEWTRHLMHDAETAPAVTTAPARHPRLLGIALAVVALLAFVTAVPAQANAIRPSGEVGKLLRFMSVDQRWDMFSPDPSRADGWMLAPATLSDGTRFDLLTGGPVDDRSERYTDPLYSRWLKVQDRISSKRWSSYRLEYARHFCRLWNRQLRPGEARLATFELWYVERTIQPPGEGPPLISPPTRFWTHKC